MTLTLKERLARRIAQDEAYAWQVAPNAAQSRKQDRYLRRAEKYIAEVHAQEMEAAAMGDLDGGRYRVVENKEAATLDLYDDNLTPVCASLEHDPSVGIFGDPESARQLMQNIVDLLNKQGLHPKWEGQFNTFQDWVNRADMTLTRTSNNNYRFAPFICVDAKGRRCWSGEQFMRARDEGAFPVRYFWEME